MKTTAMSVMQGEVSKQAAQISILNFEHYTQEDKDVIYHLYEDLRGLGLTPNEARLFLCLVVDGPTQASELSRQTGIQRTECYNYLNGLINKSLVMASFARPTIYTCVDIQTAITTMVKTITGIAQAIGKRSPDYVSTVGKLQKARDVQSGNYTRYGTKNVGENQYQTLVGVVPAMTRTRVMMDSAAKNITMVLSSRMSNLMLHHDIFGLLESTLMTRPQLTATITLQASNFIKEEIEKEAPKLKVNYVKDRPTNSYVMIDSTEVLAILESSDGGVMGMWATNEKFRDIILAANRHVH